MSTSARPAPLVLTWLGQAGFVLELGRSRVLIDPFLSDYESRRYPAGLAASELGQVDWLLSTHEHLDHFDVAWIPALLEHSPHLRVVAPSAMKQLAASVAGAERLTLVEPGHTLELAEGCSLEVVPAAHGVTVEAGYTDGSGPEGVQFVGYILRTATLGVYHSGDTLVTDAVLGALEGRSIDIALLPINGRSYFRERVGLVGNMSAREAVGLANRLGCRIVVPMHWDMFEGNTERPGAFVDEVDDLTARFHTVIPTRFAPIALA